MDKPCIALQANGDPQIVRLFDPNSLRYCSDILEMQGHHLEGRVK